MEGAGAACAGTVAAGVPRAGFGTYFVWVLARHPGEMHRAMCVHPRSFRERSVGPPGREGLRGTGHPHQEELARWAWGSRMPGEGEGDSEQTRGMLAACEGP